ncbi:MAG: SDR family oxidoreductase [Chloroflexi bacterium]|nr:MAG: SDR family oxidoreductase [Chloroflexota bacterium]
MMAHADKVMIVTGATNGIGLITARELAATGARVVLVGRSARRLADTVALITQQTPAANLDTIQADLSSQADVLAVADTIKQRYDHIDVLLNNAGAFFTEHQLSVDGIEMTWALNHMAPFLLTTTLLDLLRASAPARIITVASAAHQGATINFDDLEGKTRFSGWKAYAQSKLANIMFTYELANRLLDSDVTANCLHPGFVATGFAQNNPGWFAKAFAVMQRYMAITPEKGAETSIFLARSDSVATTTGRYFDKCKPVPSSKISYDVTTQRRLWQQSLNMVK